MPLIPLHRTLPDRHAADAHGIADIVNLQDALDSAALKVPAADGWSGPVFAAAIVGAGVAQFSTVYLDSSGLWQLADAAAESTASGLLGIVISAVIDNVAVIGLAPGIARSAAWTWTVGAAVYLGTGGALTQTEPSAGIRRRAGYAIAAHSIYFAPSVALTLA